MTLKLRSCGETAADRCDGGTLTLADVAVVVIGRNEGERLRACLESISPGVAGIVYVDSGSTDGSVEIARGYGIAVHALDMSLPFTAARARNAGVYLLRERGVNVPFVQFIDGDSTVCKGWFEAALCEFDSSNDIAVVCGRCREVRPGASMYNRICDMEWNTPVGDTESCGGNAMFRTEVFLRFGGFDESLVAGEEPELCLRLRRASWRIRRIDSEMVEHDADMKRFGQWWRRCVRCGRAYAEGFAIHGRSADRYRVREIRSIIEWTVILPLLSIGLAWPTHGWSLLALLAYGYLAHRIRRHRIGIGEDPRQATLYAIFCILGKFAELGGVVSYRTRQYSQRWLQAPAVTTGGETRTERAAA